MDHKVKISVITPCYNQANFLEETINSLIQQTFNDWECIIVNDGSTDNTEEIALALAGKDTRIKYIHQENKGVSAARNAAINISEGKYLIPVDADDLISPNYLEACFCELEKDENVKIVYAEGQKFGMQSGRCEFRNFDLKIMAYDNLIFNSAMFRKSDFINSGGYSEYLHVGEDWELWLNLLKDGGSVVKLPFIGYCYRVHNASKTRTYNWQTADHLDFIYKKHMEFYLKVHGNPISLYAQNQAYLTKLEKIRSYIPIKLYHISKRFFRRMSFRR